MTRHFKRLIASILLKKPKWAECLITLCRIDSTKGNQDQVIANSKKERHLEPNNHALYVNIVGNKRQTSSETAYPNRCLTKSYSPDI